MDIPLGEGDHNPVLTESPLDRHVQFMGYGQTIFHAFQEDIYEEIKRTLSEPNENDRWGWLFQDQGMSFHRLSTAG